MYDYDVLQFLIDIPKLLSLSILAFEALLCHVYHDCDFVQFLFSKNQYLI